jgi:hypothetical protein
MATFTIRLTPQVWQEAIDALKTLRANDHNSRFDYCDSCLVSYAAKQVLPKNLFCTYNGVSLGITKSLPTVNCDWVPTPTIAMRAANTFDHINFLDEINPDEFVLGEFEVHIPDDLLSE